MNWSAAYRVFRKELTETLRDRRALFMMIGLPIFLYPAMLIAGQQFAAFGIRLLEEEPARVQVIGGHPEILEILEADSSILLQRVAAVDTAVLLEGEAEVILRFGEPDSADGQVPVDVFFDTTRDRSRFGQQAAENVLAAWSDSLLDRRLRERGLGPRFAEPVVVRDSAVATPERVGGYALGRFLPMILILMTIMGAFYPAIDLAAGEKERGTLEPLLTTSVSSLDLVFGKFLATTAIALAAATLNLVSMLLTVRFAVFQFGDVVDLTLPLTTVLLVLLFLIPLAVVFSALFLGLSLTAQSFKEAQNALTPVYVVSLIPVLLPVIPGIPFSYGIAAVPVAGIAMLFRELMAGTAEMGPALVALASTSAAAGLCLWYAVRNFGREEVLFGTARSASPSGGLRATLAEWRNRTRPVPTPTEAVAFVAVVGLLYFLVGTVFQVRYGEAGILLSQVLLLALPAIAFATVGPYRPRSALALRTPPARNLLAALLVILGAIPVGWLLGWVQSNFIELPEEFLRALEELVRAETQGELIWLLFIVAIVPAICEELVFRGILLQGFASRMTQTRAVLLSAAIFGAFHLSGDTAIRFLPSAFLGIVLGLVVWRTGSLFTSMLMHFVNNGIVVALMFIPAAETWVLTEAGAPHWPLVVTGVVLLALGIQLLPERPPQSSPEIISSVT